MHILKIDISIHINIYFRKYRQFEKKSKLLLELYQMKKSNKLAISKSLSRSKLLLILVVLGVVLGVVLLVSLILFGRNEYFTINQNNDIYEIPKHIWAYWDTNELPDIINKCIDTWKKYNPTYEITILSKDNIRDWLPETDVFSFRYATTHQKTSDFIRILILAKYGGIWIDASTILTESLDWVFDIQKKNKCEFIGYYINKKTTNRKYPVLENWFFAAVPNSTFMANWKDAFVKLNEYDTIKDYIKYLTDSNVDLQGVGASEYFTMHLAAQYVMQKQMTPNDINTKLYLMKAEDGPLKYLALNNFTNDGIKKICNDKNLQTSIIKLPGTQRDYINKNNDTYCIFAI